MAGGAGGCQSRRLSGDEGASTLDKWIVYGLPPLEETFGKWNELPICRSLVLT